MAAFRYPVLVLEAHQGMYTAHLVENMDGEAVSAVGPTRAKAISQLKDYLRWFHKQHPYFHGLEFLDPKLSYQRVTVRPEYSHEGHNYPCSETIQLRVPYVQGHRPSGAGVCAVPTLDIVFHYYESGQLKNTVSHFIQERLEGHTPQALSRYLPAKSAALDDVVVQSRRKLPKETGRPQNALPTLEAVAEPCVSLRKQLSQGWGRETHIKELAHRLSHEKANVILVGESGAGKTTVLVQAARKAERENIDEQDISSRTSKNRFWLTSGSRLIAGMKYLGQWEQRCEQVVEELSDIGGVLCIENLLALVEAGTDPGNSVAQFFQPYLEQGELQLITEATASELEACRRLLPGFLELFQIMKLPTFSRKEAVGVLDHVAAWHTQNSPVEVERGVTELIYRLFSRFLPYQAFPGQATVFLGELFERAVQQNWEKIAQSNAITAFIQLTGLPELFVKDELPLDPEAVVETLRKAVIGQEEALRTAAGLITTFKASMNDPKKPIGSLLFCGPTGVGKTQLAKTLSQFFFGHGDEANRLIRLDMSEYAGPNAAERFLHDSGSRPSKWIRQIRRQPFAVVLLDEIEKASPEVFDVLLGVLDEGRLTDPYGRVTTLRSAIIIMTSNLGAHRMGSFGFSQGPGVAYEDEAEKFFRPEFFNRIDAVVNFKPLDQQTAKAIVTKELTEIADREGLAKTQLQLSWTDKLVQYMVQAGIDQRYGARPLQRTLEAELVGPLARFLLDHLGIRNRQVCVDVDDQGRICFELREDVYQPPLL